MGTLNENIKQLRVLRGISQVTLAEKLNVTKQCISNWENDNVLPSIEALQKIADFFGVSTDYLLGRVSENHINTDGLTESQISHIKLIVNDLKKINS
ncbi:MAG: helix-turn-helix transcriptional regulator [Clostridia bacterium]|nr:helix-turn-helix transcriptional regulator [Clostridia bacterium]